MTPEVVPEVEAFTFKGGPAGVLLLHGFTGNPSSLRPFGASLAALGHAVSCPRYPGHGTSWEELASTRWQDWESEALRAFEDLSEQCDVVVACGLSVGGAMALHLAVRRGDALRGVVAINPYVRNWRIAFAPLVQRFHKVVKGVGDDIKKPGRTEIPYDRIPVAAIVQLNRFLRLVRSELPSMRLPLLVFHSREDHVVPGGNAEYVLGRVGTEKRELILLPNSYHVATLDNDAEMIVERTHGFIQARVGARRPPPRRRRRTQGGGRRPR
ncbi:MAG TPA: alpha/beta fold hydrolase [Actinomycetota bacterium]|jgi:carboxylesterase|nr:alpha/beta fold hydrolase [Actinomycetota bacterium]